MSFDPMSFDPFDGEDHQLIIGESCKTLLGPKHKSDVQYTSLKYDYKPHRIDYEKQGILETSDASTACWIRLPLEVDDSSQSSQSRASSAFKGQRQDLQSNGVSKECILVIDRESGTITLEHVTSKVDVKQTRGGEETREVNFKPRPARKTKSSSRLEDNSSSTSSSHHHEGGPPSRKQNRPEPKIKSIPKTAGNMPEIIGMQSDSRRPSGGGESKSQSNNPLDFLSSESDSNHDTSSSSSSSSDNDDESDDSNNGQEETTNKQIDHPPPEPTTTVMADFGLDLSSESSSDDSDGS